MSNAQKYSSKRAVDVTVFLVAEPVGRQTVFNAAGLSLAMMPLANRPVIDYAIENLIRNGLHKIVILCRPKEQDAISAHVATAWTNNGVVSGGSVTATSSYTNLAHKTHHGKPAASTPLRGGDTSGGDIESIEVRSCNLDKGCFDVVAHVKHNNLVRDGDFFVIAPLDSISNISNLSDLVAKAVARDHQHKLVLTAVAQQDDKSLRSTYQKVMLNELERAITLPDKEEDNIVPIQTPYNNKPQWDIQRQIVDEEDLIDEKSFAPRCTVAFDPENGMIHAFSEWKKLEDDPLDNHNDDEIGFKNQIDVTYPPMLSIPIKPNGARVCVRTDLVLTGILICSTELFNASLNAFQKTPCDFVKEFIASQIQWNLDIAIDVANSGAIVCPLTSLEAYIAANRLITARYLHPMTRDSNFGNYVDVKYGTSRRAPLVSVPEKGCPFLRSTVEGSATFGLDVVADESSFITNTSILDNCVIGRKVSIINSVIGRNVRIKDGAIISNSIILDNSTVPENLEVAESIYAVLNPGAENFVRRQKSRYQNVFLTAEGEQKYLDSLVDDVISTYQMLTSDSIPLQDNDGSDSEDSSDAAWRETLWDSYLANPEERTNTILMSLQDFRFSLKKTNTEFIQVLFEVLMMGIGDAARDHYLEENGITAAELANSEHEDFTADWDFVKDLLVEHLSVWDSQVLWHFISLGDIKDAQNIIRGLCIGIGKRPCLQALGQKILNIFYCKLNDDMFDKREFCIVPGPAIILFLEEQEHIEKNGGEEEDEESSDSEDDGTDDDDNDLDDDTLVKRGWKYFKPLAEKVRQAFEDDSDEDDEDEE